MNHSESLTASLMTEWFPEAFIVAILLQLLYVVLVGPLRKSRGLGRPATKFEMSCFSIALLAFVVSEGSPIHAISEQYLFGIHMLQHLLLTMIMPPLMLLGLPDWAYRPLTRKGILPVARVLTHPIVALALFNATYTLWHLPDLYQAALYSHRVHYLEHITMVSTAFLMWWPITSKLPELPRLSDPLQVAYVFFMSVAQIGVFAVVTFANEVYYAYYAEAPRLWGITPMEDQQLAGIVMKVGGMIIFVFLLARAFFRWAKSEEESNPPVPERL